MVLQCCSGEGSEGGAKAKENIIGVTTPNIVVQRRVASIPHGIHYKSPLASRVTCPHELNITTQSSMQLQLDNET